MLIAIHSDGKFQLVETIVFPYGKYKRKAIILCNDKQYMEWLLAVGTNLTKKVKNALFERIKEMS